MSLGVENVKANYRDLFLVLSQDVLYSDHSFCLLFEPLSSVSGSVVCYGGGSRNHLFNFRRGLKETHVIVSFSTKDQDGVREECGQGGQDTRTEIYSPSLRPSPTIPP